MINCIDDFDRIYFHLMVDIIILFIVIPWNDRQFCVAYLTTTKVRYLDNQSLDVSEITAATV